VFADRAQVVSQRSQTYFRPDGASIEFYVLWHLKHQGYPIWARKKNWSKVQARRLVTSALKSFFPMYFAASQAAEKVIYFVILSEAKNLSWV
jgi:hypothetical protein